MVWEHSHLNQEARAASKASHDSRRTSKKSIVDDADLFGDFSDAEGGDKETRPRDDEPPDAAIPGSLRARHRRGSPRSTSSIHS